MQSPNNRKPGRFQVERRYEHLYGVELQDRIAERPIAWVPLGPLEKHGEHLPWGLDALKAHAQCLRLAGRFGGVVLPAIHVAGIHDPWHSDPAVYRRMRAEVGNFYLRKKTLRLLVEDIIDGLSNIGFKIIVLNSGHYPNYQGRFLKQIAAKKQTPQLRVIAFDEADARLPVDHAGVFETAIFMALGGKAELGRVVPEQKNKIGYWGEKTPPTDATKKLGRAWIEQIEAHFERLLPICDA
ncbi:MAG: creatininase family protein [Verrucomicrobia bacterium]|nr:creatininase family protein [Verrucomicrobiota bacterium]